MSNTENHGYTVQEASRILNKSHATIYRWIESGKLRAETESYSGGQRLRVFIDQPIEGELLDDSHENGLSNAMSKATESDKLNLAAALSIIEQQRVTLEEKDSLIEQLLREKADMSAQIGAAATRIEYLTPKQLPAPKRPWWRFWAK